MSIKLIHSVERLDTLIYKATKIKKRQGLLNLTPYLKVETGQVDFNDKTKLYKNLCEIGKFVKAGDGNKKQKAKIYKQIEIAKLAIINDFVTKANQDLSLGIQVDNNKKLNLKTFIKNLLYSVKQLLFYTGASILAFLGFSKGVTAAYAIFGMLIPHGLPLTALTILFGLASLGMYMAFEANLLKKNMGASEGYGSGYFKLCAQQTDTMKNLLERLNNPTNAQTFEIRKQYVKMVRVISNDLESKKQRASRVMARSNKSITRNIIKVAAYGTAFTTNALGYSFLTASTALAICFGIGMLKVSLIAAIAMPHTLPVIITGLAIGVAAAAIITFLVKKHGDSFVKKSLPGHKALEKICKSDIKKNAALYENSFFREKAKKNTLADTPAKEEAKLAKLTI